MKGRKGRKILITGLDIGKKIKEKENMRREDGVKEWVKNKLEVDCNVVTIRESGRVLRVESKEDKRVIMNNKHKLKGGKVFIENDLSSEERKL